jgi:transcriptional regulatory protein LevR
MKSEQFKLIRIAYKISAKKIANQLGFKSKSPVLDAEKQIDIPQQFVKVLEKLTGLKFDNEAIIEQLAIESAMTFSKLDYRNSIWNSKYSKLIKIKS